MKIIPTLLQTKIGENHLIGRREGKFHLLDIEKDKTEGYEISAAVINDLEKEAISYIEEQSPRLQDRQPTPYEEAVALHGERKIELLLSNTVQLSKNMSSNRSKDSPSTKSTSKEEKLLSQNRFFLSILQDYIKARNPNTTLDVTGGVCFGLTSLYCYYQFIGKPQDFFDAIRKVHSLINTISFDRIDKKDYDKLTDDQQFLERFCNDMLFFQEAILFGFCQSTSLKNMNFVSKDPAIQNLRSQFTFSSVFNYNHEKQSHILLEHILYRILTSDGEKRKFLFIFTGNHTFGIHYQDKKCYLYNPNTSGDQYTCLIDPENPFPAIKSLTKQLISELYLFEKKTFSLGINVLSDENLSVLKTKETHLHSLMIPHSCDFPGKEYSPLLIASHNNFKDVVKVLLKKGADPNVEDKDGVTSLHYAAMQGDKNVTRFLLEAGANPNVVDKDGITPLHEAAKQENKDVIELLLRKGADPNIKTKKGTTPLYSAAIQGHNDANQTLLKWGADPNIENKNGITPLHVAASYGHKGVTRILIEAGADLNKENKDGLTPLHDAAFHGRMDCIEILLGAGADPNIENKYGITPLDNATEQGHKDVTRILLAAGARSGKKPSKCSIS